MSSKALAGFVLSSLFLLASLSAVAKSSVRIVRLSYVEGSVQIDRNTGKYEKAFLNLPITEGVKLRAQSESRAEIEFEDGSTLRLIPDTTVQFPQLSLEDSGAKVSTVEILSGTAYITYAGAKDSSLSLVFGREKIALTKAAHLRIGVDENGAAVAVLKGDVQLDGPSGASQVKKNQTAELSVADDNKLALVKDVADQPFDAWDKQQDQYHQRYNTNSFNNYSTGNYGMADLNYYGNFFSAPGYGMMWQPYFVGAGWDPFMDGAWAFSPGGGFGWVSSYPWGWAPYHSGAWAFLPGYGWAWQPGGAWSPFYTPRVLNAPAGFAAPHAPTGGTGTVVVSRGPVPVNVARGGDKAIIRNNSAGLGVPRGEINNLAKVSQQVQTRGTVVERTHPAPVSMAAPARGSMNSGGAGAGMGPRPSSRTSGSSRPMGGPSPSMSPAPSSSPRSSAPPTAGARR